MNYIYCFIGYQHRHSVKGVAVCYEWVDNIIQSASNKLGNERVYGPVIKRDGKSFDGKLASVNACPAHDPFCESVE
jgi:hypothetical protein